MARVAVFGASGRQGMAQVRQLLAAGHQVRALSRRADPFLGHHFAGVEVVSADIADDATVIAALEGCDAAFYTQPLRGPTPGQESGRSDRAYWLDKVGRAAKTAGIKRFVWNTSSWIPDRPGDPFSYDGNTQGLNALWRSGVPATVFGSVLFMDNLLTNWALPFIARERRFVYAHRPDLLANWISLDDVAKFMIAALDRPDMEGAWMNIGGPERLTPVAVAKILSGVIGETVTYDPVTPARFAELLADAFGDEMGLAERAQTRTYIEKFYDYNNNAPTRPFEVDTAAMLERMPIELETLETWARRQDWTLSNKARPPGG